MKLLLVLLACVVAANASCPYGHAPYAYSYYCSHSWHVYPVSTSYCFHVYFPHTWCTHSYYSSILKVYPGSDCIPHWHCWRERSVSDITNEIKNLLSAQRSRMCHEMYHRRDSFLRTIIYLHNTYKWWFSYYLHQLYRYRMAYCIYTTSINYKVECNHRIHVYCTKLDSILSAVRSHYNAAISHKISVLYHYHERIVKAAEYCLNTRLAKIAEFKRHLYYKVGCYIHRFSDCHYALARKNRDHYKAILSSLFCEDNHWWISFKASIAVSYYYSRQRSIVYHLIHTYQYRLYHVKYDLIKYYTCSYKCYMTSGCLRFLSDVYHSHCYSLGHWWSYQRHYCADHYHIAPFKVKFHACHYHVLKTCDVNKVVGDISGVISHLKHQRDQICKAMEHKFHTWYCTWVHHFYAYKHAFWTIVNRRHAWLCSWQRRIYLWHCGYLTAVNIQYISHMKIDLHHRAIRACHSYYYGLLHTLAVAKSQHQHNHQHFIDSVNRVIDHVTAKFNECKSRRLADIAAYKKRLEDHRVAQRNALVHKMYEAKNAHWRKFHDMLRHYHGSCYYKYTWVRWMRDCYGHLLVNRCYRVICEFDHFWHYMNPRLLQHYSCCYKCKVGAYIVPKYHCGGFYHWCYHLPTEKCYCYKYHFWYTHYHLCK